MKLGADPKKTVILSVLGVVLVYSFYANVLSDPELPEEAKRQQQQSKSSPPAGVLRSPDVPGPETGISPVSRPGADRRANRGRTNVAEFRPSMKPARPEDRPDPMKVDPTLRLELLTRLQNINVEGGQRSLFDFSTAPPPPSNTPDPAKIIPGQKKEGEAPVVAADLKPVEPPKPPPPPIPLKFYGFTGPGSKRAFFLEGEEIHVVAEGELVKKRYKVIRINLNSAVVEDTDHKHQQTLALEEPPATG